MNAAPGARKQSPERERGRRVAALLPATALPASLWPHAALRRVTAADRTRGAAGVPRSGRGRRHGAGKALAPRPQPGTARVGRRVPAAGFQPPLPARSAPLTPSRPWDWQAGGSAWHPPSFQGSLSSTGWAHSILAAGAAGTPRLGRPEGPVPPLERGGLERRFPPRLPPGGRYSAGSRLCARTLPDCALSLS